MPVFHGGGAGSSPTLAGLTSTLLRNRGSDPAALVPKFDSSETSFSAVDLVNPIIPPNPIRVGVMVSVDGTGPFLISTRNTSPPVGGLRFDVGAPPFMLTFATVGGLIARPWYLVSVGSGGTVTIVDIWYWRKR